MTELLQLALNGIITPMVEMFEFSEAPNLIQRITKDAIRGRAVVKIP